MNDLPVGLDKYHAPQWLGARVSRRFNTLICVNRFNAPRTWDTAHQPMIGAPEARPGHPQSAVMQWSVDPEEYGRFLGKIWDEWIAPAPQR